MLPLSEPSNIAGTARTSSRSSGKKNSNCLPCRRRKQVSKAVIVALYDIIKPTSVQKCDTQRPVCGRCASRLRAEECRYDEVKRPKQILLDRIAELELKLESHQGPSANPTTTDEDAVKENTLITNSSKSLRSCFSRPSALVIERPFGRGNGVSL